MARGSISMMNRAHNTPDLINPAILKMVRDAAGFNQQQLAARIGLAQGTISKFETGILQPTDDQLRSLVRELGVDTSYVMRADEPIVSGDTIFHRQRKARSIREQTRVHARMVMTAMAWWDLMARVDSDVLPIPVVDEYERADIGGITARLRQLWKIPAGPIASMSRVLYAAGVVMIPFDFGATLVDATVIAPPGKTPLIFYNPDTTDDRLRFSLAHELGHLVIQAGKRLDIPEKDMEADAHYFASCFLMPPHEIASQLDWLSIAKLGRLKQTWKVSMQAILMAAKHHGAISTERQEELWQEFGRKGYRTREPEIFDVHCETPDIGFREILDLFTKDLGYTAEDLGRLTMLDSSWIGSLLGVYDKNPVLQFRPRETKLRM